MQILTQEGKRTIPDRSIEAQFLYERLSKSAVGEIITYAEMDELIGRSVQKQCRQALQTARNACKSELRILFGTIAKVGLKRLSNDEIPGLAESKIAHIRRTVKRGLTEQMCADYESLQSDQKTRYNMNMAMFSTYQELSKPSSINSVENQVKMSQATLPVGKVLKLFVNN